MPELVSKLQFKTYEKGEFSNEKPRSLDDTLLLIKNFPWDVQRGADVQLSGPGVVISGANGDYLKIALYFNNKFSAYYLNTRRQLYEYHTANLSDELDMVEHFFAGDLDLRKFDKHFLNFGNQAHLTTNTFEYPSAKRPRIFYGFLAVVYTAFCTAILISTHQAFAILGITAFFVIVAIVAYVSNFSEHNRYLKLSKGQDEFFFGEDRDHINTYNKGNIREVLILARRAKGVYYDAAFISFKDGTMINVPPKLIPTQTLMSKFDEKLIRIEWTYSIFYSWLK